MITPAKETPPPNLGGSPEMGQGLVGKKVFAAQFFFSSRLADLSTISGILSRISASFRLITFACPIQKTKFS